MISDPFGALAPLRELALPDMAQARRDRTRARARPLNLDDPRAAEPLVDIADLSISGSNFYASQRNPPYYRAIPGAIDRVLVREEVGRLLQNVQRQLTPLGLELFLFDGWRPTAVQAYFHDYWLPAELRRRMGGISESEIHREVTKYWAAPTTHPASPAPHNTGGAVDLTIRWKDTGEHLWMGSLFDDASNVANLDYFEKRLARRRGLAFSDEEARANRRMLYWLMTGVGFAAHPLEWWHYGYGERMWAQLSRAPFAFYGPARP